MMKVGAAWVLILPVAYAAEAGPTPGEGYIEVEGGRVWYEIVGAGPGTPLLLLHGGPGAPSEYLRPMAALGSDRPVVFYDQLGAGRSDRPSDPSLWRVERFVDELATVRQVLGLEQIHLYGHSWGTMLAVEYMLTNPDGVQSLTLASPAISVRRWSEDAERLLAQLPVELQQAIERHEVDATTHDPEYEAAVMEYYRRFLCRRDPWPPELQQSLEILNMDVYGRMWGPSEFTATGTLKNFERESALPDLQLPVLYTVGRYDEVTPETVRHYSELTPHSRLEILEDSAHMTMLDEPETYNAVIRRFLAEVETAAGAGSQ
jgi:proline iminopeptidase